MEEESKGLEVEKSESSDKPAPKPSPPKAKTVEFVRPAEGAKSSRLVTK
jgi:hypothetical protein